MTQQYSPLEQSARGVLQDNSRCPLGVLTLSNPVQHASKEDHAGTLSDQNTCFSIAGRPLCHLLFAEDIDIMGDSIGELHDHTNRLADRARAYGIEVSTEKS